MKSNVIPLNTLGAVVPFRNEWVNALGTKAFRTEYSNALNKIMIEVIFMEEPKTVYELVCQRRGRAYIDYALIKAFAERLVNEEFDHYADYRNNLVIGEPELEKPETLDDWKEWNDKLQKSLDAPYSGGEHG